MKCHHDHKSALGLIILMCVALSACKEQPQNAAQLETQQSQWLQPPSIISVTWNGASAHIIGVANPGSRVVFAGQSDQSYAANADAEGDFALWVNVPAEGLILQPRLQLSGTSVAGPGQLFVSSAEVGVAAVMFPGEGSYRLSGEGPLDAVDSDGRTLIVSGRIAGTVMEGIVVDGREVSIDPNEDGRWAIVVPTIGSTTSITVAGKHYLFNGDLANSVTDSSQAGGLYIKRDLGDGAVQTTWLPFG